MKLRDYQFEGINLLQNSMREGHKRIIFQLGTGGGKTVCFTYMVKTASERGKRCMILTDRMALLEQAGGTFENFGLVNYAEITRNTRAIPNYNVIVAMAETIKRRCDKRLDYQMMLARIDLLIIDEAHKATFDKIFAYLSPSCIVIGATATPISANPKKPLSLLYTDLVQGKSIQWMYENGYLAKPWYGRKELADFSGLRKKGGDFNEKQLEKIYTEVKVFEGLIEAKERDWGNRKTIIFCPNVNVSKRVAEELGCLHVDGYMSLDERKEAMEKFENDPHGVITNVDLLTTGYDHPPIVNIVLYRDTLSLPLFLQMCGRGSRICEGKDKFFIYDFGRNIERHGYWHIDRVWSLDPPKKNKKKEKLDIFPVKDCPQCGSLIPATARKCPECGYEYPVTEQEKIKVKFKMMSYEEVNEELKKAETMKEKELIRETKGYKQGWLFRQFESVQDFSEYAEMKGYKKGWVKRQVNFYLE